MSEPSVRDLHHEAMRLAMDATIALDRDGDETRALALYREAVPFEVKAASLIACEPASEPTRSILYRSAGWLAFNAGDFTQARLLALEGLKGWPPPREHANLDELLAELEKIT